MSGRYRPPTRKIRIHGTLYIARFNEDGSGEWLELSMDVPDIASAFADLGEMLVNVRSAADIVGGTPMDRPEWVAAAPNGGQRSR